MKWMLRVVFEESLMSGLVEHVCLKCDANQDGGHGAGIYVVSLS